MRPHKSVTRFFWGQKRRTFFFCEKKTKKKKRDKIEKKKKKKEKDRAAARGKKRLSKSVVQALLFRGTFHTFKIIFLKLYYQILLSLMSINTILLLLFAL